MTWSIIARDEDGSLGIAIASRFFAVGALCPHVRANVGAVATQALCNPLYAAPALDAMSRGETPASIVEALTAGDDGREHRQIHMIDARGRIGAYTGAACIDWCGQTSAERFQPFVGCLPSRRTPAGIFDRVAIEAEIARFQSARRKG